MSANLAFRLFGIFCLLLAAAIAWWGIWLPYEQALAQAPRVHYRIMTFVLVPFAAVFGLFFLIFGASLPYRNAERQTPTLAGLVVLILAAGASGITFWWFDARFGELGYPYPGASRAEKEVVLPIPAGTPPPIEQPRFER